MRALAQPYPWAQNLDGREPGPQANKQQKPTVSRTDMDSIELDTNKKLTRHDVKEGVIAMNDAASRQKSDYSPWWCNMGFSATAAAGQLEDSGAVRRHGGGSGCITEEQVVDK